MKAPKTENVVCWRQGKSVRGSLHLTQHHIIFRYPNPSAPKGPAEKETWITYPMVGHCSYRPSPLASHQPSSIRLRCRDFNFIAFHFENDSAARAVFESIRSLTCRLEHIDKLYAFTNPSNAAERPIKGWKVYDAKKEFERMGLTSNNNSNAWRLSSINSTYQVR